MLGSVWLPLNTSTVWRLRNIDSNLERLALTRRSRNVDYTATGGFEEEVRNDQVCPNGMILNAVALRNHQSHHGVRSVMY